MGRDVCVERLSAGRAGRGRREAEDETGGAQAARAKKGTLLGEVAGDTNDVEDVEAGVAREDVLDDRSVVRAEKARGECTGLRRIERAASTERGERRWAEVSAVVHDWKVSA